MRVLITGSNGLLGQKLVDRMVGIPDVEILATSLNTNVINYSSGYDFKNLDITNYEQCKRVVGRFCPHVIVNTAAISHVDVCESDPLQCQKVNVDGVKNLVDLANQCGAHMVHLSTDFVFNGECGPYTEQDVPDPLSCYGISKQRSEEWIVANSNRWAIVRTVLVYGVNPNMTRSNIVLWVKNALEAGESIKVVDDQVRTPTLVEDLAEGIFQVVALGARGVFHISGAEQYSVFEIAQQVAQSFNLPMDKISSVSSMELNEKAKRPLRTGFIIDKARIQLGYCPHDLVSGLSIVKEQLSNYGQFKDLNKA